MQRNGIDISRWQGAINWAEVKDSKDVDFVIVKAGGSNKGRYTDKYFASNYKAATEYGFDVGAYYFVGPKFEGHEAGVADAKHFLEILGDRKFTYPVFVDIESTNPYHAEDVTTAAIAFCETMEAAGYYVGIYASDVGGFKERLVYHRLMDYDKWVARYGKEPQYVSKDFYGMWQHSSKGSIAGISGNVDMDISYKDYPTIMKKNGLNHCGSAPVAKPTPAPAPAPAPKPTPTKVTPTVKVDTPVENDPARSRDSRLAGTYVTTGRLNLRSGAGTDKRINAVIPSGHSVKCYGYYTSHNGSKWLYVTTTINGKACLGFCSSKYLKKK